LNNELKVNAEKSASLENLLVELKSEQESQIEYLTIRLNRFEETFKASSQHLIERLNELKNPDSSELIQEKQKTSLSNQMKNANKAKSGFIYDKLNNDDDDDDNLSNKLIFNKNRKRKNYSLAHNVSINDMKSQGYQVVYDYPYSHYTNISELNAIRQKCSPDTVLCAGGVAAEDSDNLLLVSCANCYSVLTSTQLDKPVLNNGAYWYLTNEKSFGFSPSSNIKQSWVDMYDCNPLPCTDNKRLSWYLGGGYGGWRLGDLYHLNNSNHFDKIILLS
jgi:hypothetical protein